MTGDVQIPTVLLVLGNTNAEIMRIHARYTVLALLLSVANINKRPDRAQPLRPAPRVSLGPYGTIRQRDAAGPPKTSISIETVHVLAALGVGIVLWQAVEIGRNGVATWACWKDFHPGLWVVLAFLQYVIPVVVLRTSLHVTATAAPSSARQQPARAMSALACWDSTSPGIHLEVTRKRLVKWGKAIADLVNNVIYLYGTAVFSSLRLIPGRAAIQKLAAFGITVAARMVAVFVLEDIDGED
jgi:hypothetical protein